MKRLLLAVAAFLCLAAARAQVSPISQPHVAFVDASGNPCAGCKLYTYLAGTTTPQPTYTDSTQIPQNTNPIVLDASASANIWLGPSAYKLILKNASGTTLWSVDNVPGSIGGEYLSRLVTTPQSMAGPLLVPKVNQTIYASQWPGVVCDGTHDDTVGLQLAINAGAPTGTPGNYTSQPLPIVFPNTNNDDGSTFCKITATLTVGYSGAKFLCAARSNDGGSSGCKISGTISPLIHVSVGYDPQFTMIGLTLKGAAGQQAATNDGVQIDSDAGAASCGGGNCGGNLDSEIDDSFFYNLRWPVIVNGRNFRFDRNVLSENTHGIHVIVPGTGAWVYGTATDIRDFEIRNNTLESNGTNCETAAANGLPYLFQFDANAAHTGVFNIDVSGTQDHMGWYSTLVNTNYASNVTVQNNTRDQTMGGIAVYLSTSNVNQSGNTLHGWTQSDYSSCNVNQYGTWADTLTNSTIRGEVYNHLARDGISVSALVNSSITGNTISDIGLNNASTYSGMRIGGAPASSNSFILGNTIKGGTPSYMVYGIQGASNPAYNLFIFANALSDSNTRDMSTGNAFDLPYWSVLEGSYGMLARANTMQGYFASGGGWLNALGASPGAQGDVGLAGSDSAGANTITYLQCLHGTGACNFTQGLSIAGGAVMSTNQGTGTKVQHSTGSTTTNNCGKFDANGNIVDSGAACQGSTRTCSGTAPNESCYETFGNGTIHEFGTIQSGTLGATWKATTALTFPLAFPTAIYSTFCDPGSPGGSGDPTNPIFCWTNSASTSGVTLYTACVVEIGGGGCSGVKQNVTLNWEAYGH